MGPQRPQVWPCSGRGSCTHCWASSSTSSPSNLCRCLTGLTTEQRLLKLSCDLVLQPVPGASCPRSKQRSAAPGPLQQCHGQQQSARRVPSHHVSSTSAHADASSTAEENTREILEKRRNNIKAHPSDAGKEWLDIPKGACAQALYLPLASLQKQCAQVHCSLHPCIFFHKSLRLTVSDLVLMGNRKENNCSQPSTN